MRLEDGLGDLDAEHVVLARLEAAEVLGEDRERPLDRRLDDDLVADGVALLRWCAHVVLLVRLLDGRLVGGQGSGPEPVEIGAQRAEAVGVDAVDAAGARGWSITSPASLSTLRCCETAGRLTGSSPASSPTARGRSARRSKIARRVGSPRAVHASSW